MSAAEVVRLANIALAEVGLPEMMKMSPLGNGFVRISFPSAYTGNPLVIRANLLARMKVYGPDKECGCAVHPSMMLGLNGCAKVPVRDALMGRTCGVS